MKFYTEDLKLLYSCSMSNFATLDYFLAFVCIYSTVQYFLYRNQFSWSFCIFHCLLHKASIKYSSLNDIELSVIYLGRLDVSVVDGLTPAGQYDTFYSYGCRDFGLYRVSDFSEVYNSGNEFEEILARDYESIFNTNPNSNSASPEEAFDTRSDNRVSWHLMWRNIPLYSVGLVVVGMFDK